MRLKKDILAPISNVSEFHSLIESGATELYCGYVPEYWNAYFNRIDNISDYRYQIGINKKDSPKANISSLSELEEISRISIKNGIDLFLTLNSSSYPNLAYTHLQRLLDEITGIGIKDVIVSDVGLMKYISANYPDIRITVSCLAQVTNSFSARFYKQFNIRRIVFPRHINQKDMLDIVINNTDIEFEFFILGGKCIYDDGYCRCNHDLGPVCMDSFNSDFFSRSNQTIDYNQMRDIVDNFYRWTVNYPNNENIEDIYRNIGCSVCLLSSTLQLENLCSVKIAGRGKSLMVKRNLINIAKNAIELASSGCNTLKLQDYVRDTFMFNTDICSTNRYCFTRGDVDV